MALGDIVIAEIENVMIKGKFKFIAYSSYGEALHVVYNGEPHDLKRSRIAVLIDKPPYKEEAKEGLTPAYFLTSRVPKFLHFRQPDILYACWDKNMQEISSYIPSLWRFKNFYEIGGLFYLLHFADYNKHILPFSIYKNMRAKIMLYDTKRAYFLEDLEFNKDLIMHYKNIHSALNRTATRLSILKAKGKIPPYMPFVVSADEEIYGIVLSKLIRRGKVLELEPHVNLLDY